MYSLPIKTIDETQLQQINREYQIYFVLVTILISLQLICNTIEPIILNFKNFILPASAIFYVFSFAISDLLTENFGFKLAIRATLLNIIAQLVFCGIAIIAISMPQKFQNFESQNTFKYLFHFLSLELWSSILSLLIAKVTNDYLINKLKLLFLGKGFWWRTIVSTIIGEIVMLNIDYNISFYGRKTFYVIENLVFNAMVYKVFAAVILALPITLLSRHIAKNTFILKPSMNIRKPFLTELKDAFIFK